MERNFKDWKPFIHGGLASIIAELGKKIIIKKELLPNKKKI